jgi:AbrB family looped-hinge helix DNA binding protein
MFDFHGTFANIAIMNIRATISASGRLSLPADIRKRYGLASGGQVIVVDAGDCIVLKTVDQVINEAQARARTLLGAHSTASVDDFLADKRAQAERE